jgi:FdhD protein
VDKVIGWALLNHVLPLSKHVLLVSGRASFEIVQKSLAAGIPVLAAISAASSLAVDLAGASNQALIGFLRGSSMTVYCGGERLADEE